MTAGSVGVTIAVEEAASAARASGCGGWSDTARNLKTNQTEQQICAEMI